MKSIILFTNSLDSGGQERQMSILANLLVEKEYLVTLTTINDSKDHYVLNKKIERIKLCKENRHRIIKFLKIFFYFLFSKTDCIISYGQRESFFMLIPMLLRKKTKIICSERNFTVGKSSVIEKVLVKVLYKRADVIVPNNYSQSRHLISLNKKLEHKVHTIINYTELDKFVKQEPPNNEITEVGVFCRYERQKNCIAFIQMLSLLRDKYKRNVIIKWHGSKQFSNPVLLDYYNEIEKLINVLKLQDIIILNDATKNVVEAMKSFDVICLPSIHEGFSNSISEAICCGKPMLVSNVSDNSLMVKEGVNGFLFDPYDINNMCECFLKFLDLPKEQKIKMGNESRKIAEVLFDKNIFINEYIKLIEG